MNNSKVVVHRGLYEFIKDAQLKQQKIAEIVTNDMTESDPYLTFTKFSALIPKVRSNMPKRCLLTHYFQVFLIRVEDTTVAAVKENSINDFSAKLHLLVVRVF